MRRAIWTAIAAATAVTSLTMSGAALASTVVHASCDPVTDADIPGCLFAGNINQNPNPTNVNGFKNAEAAYNAWAIAHGNPTITLNWITQSGAGDFADFGSITGAGMTSGTFDLSGWDIEYYAVKASNQFVLYEYLGTDGTGSWMTNGQRHGLSHISFFGSRSAVPEPGTWAMLLLGFGAIGFAMRSRRKSRGGEMLQIV